MPRPKETLLNTGEKTMPIDYSKFKHRVTLHKDYQKDHADNIFWPVIETVWAVVAPPINSDMSKMDFPFIRTITIPDVPKYHNTKRVTFGVRGFIVEKKYSEDDNGQKVIHLHCKMEDSKSDIAIRMAFDYLTKEPKPYSYMHVCDALRDALDEK